MIAMMSVKLLERRVVQDHRDQQLAAAGAGEVAREAAGAEQARRGARRAGRAGAGLGLQLAAGGRGRSRRSRCRLRPGRRAPAGRCAVVGAPRPAGRDAVERVEGVRRVLVAVVAAGAVEVVELQAGHAEALHDPGRAGEPVLAVAQADADADEARQDVGAAVVADVLDDVHVLVERRRDPLARGACRPGSRASAAAASVGLSPVAAGVDPHAGALERLDEGGAGEGLGVVHQEAAHGRAAAGRDRAAHAHDPGPRLVDVDRGLGAGPHRRHDPVGGGLGTPVVARLARRAPSGAG